ncbi:kinase-like domain-containing protein [Mycena rebaudengoi]|nr:kinase-like domain-containing protein [Mycena rebaudengoi]
MTETTTTTMMSSLLDFSRSNRYGTIRSITTDATSEAPSITRTEGSFIAEDLARKRGSREPKLSESFIDPSRVEEMDEAGTTSRGMTKRWEQLQAEAHRPEKPAPAIRLGKGKWPDDFIEALSPSSPTSPQGPARLSSSSSSSTSSLRKLAIVGASKRNESVESLQHFPRRPSHRVRHSVDTPSLLPKDSIMRRESSPDGMPARSKVVIPRRNSAKPSLQRNGSLAPRSSLDESRDHSTDSLVPFPRTASGEYSASSTPPERTRPSRSRFESMMLGVALGNTSADDLLKRDSLDGSFVRQALIIREEGKPLAHFQLGNCIGRGQFGSVYRALNLNTGQMVAVKRIRLEGLKEDEVTKLMREVDLVKSLSHPSIVEYEGMARDQDTLSIVMEYAESGSLEQTLKVFGKLDERLVASYVVKILEGLHYLHSSDVVHCDLKASNILTTKSGNVKLSDFGVSLNLRAMEREIKDVVGTPNWMAPEVIELKGASPKSDIWSLACTVIELLTGRPPYAEIANSMSVMFRIVEDDMPPLPEGCTPLLEDFLSQCFNKDPTKRPSAVMLCEHPWLKKNWGAHKELRPQDSIPFLRRVSADLQKSEAVRFLSQIDMPDSPASHDGHSSADDHISGSPPRVSISSRPMDQGISSREHSFVKTTFSKPMVCRVCLLNVKKSAVLCEQCSLIAHSKCANNAPPTCDLRAQLLLYAQYAETGNSRSAYSNPLDVLNEPLMSPSEVAYVSHTPRTSIDGTPPAQAQAMAMDRNPETPPTAFKFMAAFNRSRSNPSPEPLDHVSLSGSVPLSGRNNQKSLDETRSPDIRRTRSRATSKSGVSDAADASLSIPRSMPPDVRHQKRSESRSCIVQ